MSRRHKTEEESNYKPQPVESHEDGHPKKSRWSLKSSSLLNIIAERKDSFFAKVSSIIANGFFKENVPLNDIGIEVDENWVKIPRKYFERILKPDFDSETTEKAKPKRGRPKISQLFHSITDSKLVVCFKETLHAVLEKCKEFYENSTQYVICFLFGSNQAFSTDEVPYGKLSHYHRVLKGYVDELPTRRTFSYYFEWFVGWTPVVGLKETPKEKNETFKHRLWEKLIKWIYDHLLEKYPEYAVA